MTKIEIEKKPKRSFLPLLLALLVIALVAVGVYFYLENQRRAEGEAPAGGAPAPGDTLTMPPAGLELPPAADGGRSVHALVRSRTGLHTA